MVKKISKKIAVEYVKCVWGTLCSLSSIDNERNNVSLFNIIEQFNIPDAFFVKQIQENTPLIFPVQYELVLFWKRAFDVQIFDSEITSDFKIKIVDPSGVTISETLAPIHFPKNMKRMRFRARMDGIPLTIVGDYTYQVETKLSKSGEFKKILEIPFEVNKV